MADLIAVGNDPLRGIAMTQDVRFVIKGGRICKGPIWLADDYIDWEDRPWM